MPNPVRTVWTVLRYHLLFFLPVRLDEFVPGTDRARKFAKSLAEWKASLSTLDDLALEQAIVVVRDELAVVRASISEVRSRAAQLLAVTGFITVIATLGASPPPGGGARLASLIALVLAVYALVGTLWLTVQALAVRTWAEFPVRVGRRDSARADGERYAYDLYRVYRQLRVRRDQPVGYLRDAYWFFLATILLIVVLVVIRVVAAALGRA